MAENNNYTSFEEVISRYENGRAYGPWGTRGLNMCANGENDETTPIPPQSEIFRKSRETSPIADTISPTEEQAIFGNASMTPCEDLLATKSNYDLFDASKLETSSGPRSRRGRSRKLIPVKGRTPPIEDAISRTPQQFMFTGSPYEEVISTSTQREQAQAIRLHNLQSAQTRQQSLQEGQRNAAEAITTAPRNGVARQLLEETIQAKQQIAMSQAQERRRMLPVEQLISMRQPNARAFMGPPFEGTISMLQNRQTYQDKRQMPSIPLTDATSQKRPRQDETISVQKQVAPHRSRASRLSKEAISPVLENPTPMHQSVENILTMNQQYALMMFERHQKTLSKTRSSPETLGTSSVRHPFEEEISTNFNVLDFNPPAKKEVVLSASNHSVTIDSQIEQIITSPSNKGRFKRLSTLSRLKAERYPDSATVARTRHDEKDVYPFLSAYTSDISREHETDLYHAHLGDDAIRLLEVLPGTMEDPVVCRLHVATLPDARLEYEALSYCWERDGGGLAQDKQISCNGKYVHIGENLFQAIRRVRYTAGHRIIWADALCINQKDPKEQMQQVRKMNSIFKLAFRVLVWLGEGNAKDPHHPDIATWGNPSPAFLGVCNVVNDWRRDNAFASRIPVATYSSVTGELHQLACDEGNDRQTQKNMLDLFQCRWFQRVWVIQEAALARRATVLWGPCEISWDWIGLAAAITRTQFKGHPEGTAGRSEQQGGVVPTGVVNAYFMYRISQSQTHFKPLTFSFYRLLVLTRQFQCKNRLDKIFGILGIPTTDQSTQGGEPFVQPDYSKSIEEVYHEIACKIIDSSSSLALLSSVQRAPESDVLYSNLPSWVPQWHYLLTRTLTPMEPDENFQPAAGRPFHRRPDPDRAKLIVRGIDVEAVSGIGELLPFVMEQIPLRNHSDGYDMSLNSIASTAQTNGDSLPGSMSGSSKTRTTCAYKQLEELALTLTAGKDWYGLPVKDMHAHSDDFAHCILLYGLERILNGAAFGQPEGHDSTTPTIDTAGLACLPSTTAIHDGSRFIDTAAAVIKDRKLFSTTSGMKGVGPRDMLPGDRVCVLYGANMPFILRRQDNGYILIGECYVHDLMHGEAVQRLSDAENGLEETWIKLI